MPVSSSSKTWLDDQEAYYDEEATKLSNVIDEGLKQELLRRKEKSKKEVKVLLLGQSESGKSTLHKQFQLLYASQTLESERPYWRTVVYLNIIRAVCTILVDGLSKSSSESLPEADVLREDEDELLRLQTKLLPFLAAKNSIASKLNGGLTGKAFPYAHAGVSSELPKTKLSTNDMAAKTTPDIALTAMTLLQNAQNDIEVLWKSPFVHKLISLRILRLEESAPFFLNNLPRILKDEYLPTTEDILNARIQTFGVVEHRLPMRRGSQEMTWRMYDVGGARSQRHAWIPYFDDATAIIFLAPISAFDQHLEEDRRVNRIEDSLQLFSIICSNKLLKKASLVLLLNKVDVLKQKLESGTRVSTYIPTYGKRENDYRNAAEYFRTHFKQIHHRSESHGRNVYIHFTTMVDTKAMRIVIADVGDTIVQKHMEDAGLV